MPRPHIWASVTRHNGEWVYEVSTAHYCAVGRAPTRADAWRIAARHIELAELAEVGRA